MSKCAATLTRVAQPPRPAKQRHALNVCPDLRSPHFASDLTRPPHAPSRQNPRPTEQPKTLSPSSPLFHVAREPDMLPSFVSSWAAAPFSPALPSLSVRRCSPSPTLLRSAFRGTTLAFPTAVALAPARRAFADSHAPPTMAAATLADLEGLKDISGNPLDASTFAGKVVFAMNVASACGFTKPGYTLLKHLTDKYPSSDFVAVAIPCNAFGWQESGSPDDIRTFALARAERLVITERSSVNGNDPHPIVGVAKNTFPGPIMWNFDGRFVFDRNGTPVARFGNSASTTEIEAAIDKVM